MCNSNLGRKQNPMSDLEAIRDILYAKRADYGSMLEVSGIPVTTLWRWTKQSAIKKVNTYVKPILLQKRRSLNN